MRGEDEALVEITLQRPANLHAREYQHCLPSEAVLRRKLMPWAEQAGVRSSRRGSTLPASE